MHMITSPDEGIQIIVNGQAVHYKLVGVMYDDFMSRFVAKQRHIGTMMDTTG